MSRLEESDRIQNPGSHCYPRPSSLGCQSVQHGAHKRDMTDISNEEYPKKTRCRKTQATGTDENLLKHIARLHRAMFHNGGPLPHFHISAFILYQFQTSPQPVRKSGLILIHIQCMLESARVMIPSVWRMPSGRKCNLRNKWTMMIG